MWSERSAKGRENRKRVKKKRVPHQRREEVVILKDVEE